MNETLLDRLTSRRVSIALMAFVVGAAVIGAVVPQRSNSAGTDFVDWQTANPALASIVDTLQLDAVFSSWWFLLGLALFLVSLSIATWRMVASAWRRWRTSELKPRTLVEGASAEKIAAAAKAEGYRETRTEDSSRRFVRHRLGLWGAALMHLGMVVAVVAALYSAGFDAYAVADLSTGETHEAGEEFLFEEHGLFGSPPDLGMPLRLDEVDGEFWPSGELRFINATVSVLENGTWTQHELSANYPLTISGYTIYITGGEFGEAAFVELSGENLPDDAVRFEFGPVAPGDVGYTDFQPQGWPVVQARFDPSGVRDEKPLALRVEEADETTHQVLLDVGESGDFGPYAATYVAQGRWARLILVRPAAVGIIFAGFAIIGLGSLMTYMWIPRELVIVESAEGVRYSWRAARLPRAYREELDTILERDGDST